MRLGYVKRDSEQKKHGTHVTVTIAGILTEHGLSLNAFTLGRRERATHMIIQRWTGSRFHRFERKQRMDGLRERDGE